MKNLIELLLHKILCAARIHYYHPFCLNVEFVCEDDGCWVYHVDNRCTYCKHVYCTLVNIPKPVTEKEQHSDLIQHVGYDEAQCGREK